MVVAVADVTSYGHATGMAASEWFSEMLLRTVTPPGAKSGCHHHHRNYHYHGKAGPFSVERLKIDLLLRTLCVTLQDNSRASS